jgi:hypothetical protein
MSSATPWAADLGPLEIERDPLPEPPLAPEIDKAPGPVDRDDQEGPTAGAEGARAARRPLGRAGETRRCASRCSHGRRLHDGTWPDAIHRINGHECTSGNRERKRDQDRQSNEERDVGAQPHGHEAPHRSGDNALHPRTMTELLAVRQYRKVPIPTRLMVASYQSQRYSTRPTPET